MPTVNNLPRDVCPCCGHLGMHSFNLNGQSVDLGGAGPLADVGGATILSKCRRTGARPIGLTTPRGAAASRTSPHHPPGQTAWPDY